MSTLNIYKSSAGSGKTYTLTASYLELLFRQEQSYRNILAVTFTNKAAAEMKGRILEKLYQLYKGDPASDDMAGRLAATTGLTRDAVAKKARHILLQILNDYTAFRVETIDKFFQWVIRSFARETGLQAGYNLELNNKRILAEAVDLLMFSMESDENLKNWLIRFAEEKIYEGKDWNFNKEILQLGEEIFKEKYQDITGGQKNAIIQKEKINDYLKIIRNEISGFEAYLSKIGTEAINHIYHEGLTIDDFSYKSSGVAGYLKKLADKSDFDPKSRARAALNAPDKWASADSENFTEIGMLVKDKLNSLLEQAINYHDQHIEDYKTARIILRNLFAFGILTDIYINVREIAAENNIFLLSDATVFLKRIIGRNEAPFIFEKAGNYFHHFMLDEFQDTSGYQWNNFYPLIINGLSSNRDSLIVGDVKQAIYRWRNSDWEILASQAENSFPHFNLRISPLDTNWRSYKEIVAFNNSLFSLTGKKLSDLIEQDIAEVSPDIEFTDLWKKTVDAIYGNCPQMVSSSKMNSSGYVEVSFYDGIKKEEYLGILENELPQLILEIQSRGYKPGDIAILVRKASQGRNVASILMNYANTHAEPYRFNIISNDSLYVENHSCVRFLIAVLNYLNNPGDNINSGFLRHEYIRYLMVVDNTEPDLDQIFRDCDKGMIPGLSPAFDVFLNEIERICHLSLFELVEELICIFGLNLNPENIAFLQAFQDIVLDFVNEDTSDLSSFLKWWEQHGSSQTLNVSEAQDAIRILTIHKAKGLQFPLVIIPFCDWAMDVELNQGNYLWCRNNTEPFNFLEYVPVNYQKDLLQTHFRREYQVERFHNYIDNLNLLYVALTRPMEEMYIMANRSDKANVAHFIYNAVKDGQSLVQDKSVYPFLELNIKEENGIEKIITGKKSVPKEKSLKIIPEFIEEYPVNHNRDKLNLNTKNAWLDINENDWGRKIGYGTVMHEIFSRIDTGKDIEHAVKKAFLEGKIPSEDLEITIDLLTLRLNKKDVREWFDGSWKVMKEREICISGAGFYRPDRVMVKGNEVVILDFKFGEDMPEKDIRQVLHYAEAIKRMGFLKGKAYLWYFTKDILREVI